MKMRRGNTDKWAFTKLRLGVLFPGHHTGGEEDGETGEAGHGQDGGHQRRHTVALVDCSVDDLLLWHLLIGRELQGVGQLGLLLNDVCVGKMKKNFEAQFGKLAQT